MKKTDQEGVWCHTICFRNHKSASLDPLSLFITGLDIPNTVSYLNVSRLMRYIIIWNF